MSANPLVRHRLTSSPRFTRAIVSCPVNTSQQRAHKYPPSARLRGLCTVVRWAGLRKTARSPLVGHYPTTAGLADPPLGMEVVQEFQKTQWKTIFQRIKKCENNPKCHVQHHALFDFQPFQEPRSSKRPLTSNALVRFECTSEASRLNSSSSWELSILATVESPSQSVTKTMAPHCLDSMVCHEPSTSSKRKTNH